MLHHPYGRYGSKVGIYTPMTTEQHRAIHKMYGYGNGKGDLVNTINLLIGGGLLGGYKCF